MSDLLTCDTKKDSDSVCDEAAIKRAIADIGSKLKKMKLMPLVNRYGENAFNSEYLNEAYDELALTRMRDSDIFIQPIIFNALQRFDIMEEDFSGEPFWEYLKCFLKILQSDPISRMNVSGGVSNERLGI